MLLVIDIGNSNIVIGIFKKDKCIFSWRIQTTFEKTSDEYGLCINQLFQLNNISVNKIKGIVISNVVPALTLVFEDMCKKYFNINPIIVNADLKTGIIIKYHNPMEVGADRIVNAVAVYEKYPTPAIIIDFGTATTFDYITEKGEYLGGAILPGIGISAQALFEHTAKLPKVEISKPQFIIGRNTVANIQSGIFYGTIGQIKEIIAKMKDEVNNPKKIAVIATGGYIELIKQEATPIDYFIPDLTLIGLQIIYKKNCKRSGISLQLSV